MAKKSYKVTWTENVTRDYVISTISQAITMYNGEQRMKEYEGKFPNEPIEIHGFERSEGNNLRLKIEGGDLGKALNGSRQNFLFEKIIKVLPLEEKIKPTQED